MQSFERGTTAHAPAVLAARELTVAGYTLSYRLLLIAQVPSAFTVEITEGSGERAAAFVGFDLFAAIKIYKTISRCRVFPCHLADVARDLLLEQA